MLVDETGGEMVRGRKRREEKEGGGVERGGERGKVGGGICVSNIFHIPSYTFIYLYIPLYTFIYVNIPSYTFK